MATDGLVLTQAFFLYSVVGIVEGKSEAAQCPAVCFPGLALHSTVSPEHFR